MRKNILILILTLCIIGCTSTKVERVNIKDKVDITGAWNDFDAMLVSEEMIKDSLTRPWLSDFLEDHGRHPVVTIRQSSVDPDRREISALIRLLLCSACDSLRRSSAVRIH